VKQTYINQARMLMRAAPLLFDETLALRGGTAINLFITDMPRLSVDLDLTFLDYQASRQDALASITGSMRVAAERLRATGFQTFPAEDSERIEHTLYVEQDGLRVKIEVNKVIRGTVQPPRVASLVPRARDILGIDVELAVVSDEDVYGGKLVAALDRQHPRDLFDIAHLFAGQGLTPAICRAFVVYLASHNRPIHEVLFAREADITHEYESSFVGMTDEPFSLQEMFLVRTQLLRDLPAALTHDQRRFLVSLAEAQPEWSLLNVPHASELPAVRWKLQNLQKLAAANPKKLYEQRDELVRRLEGLA
jgi:predicted nucleotidyltransferase component of viral defense system